MKRKTLWMVATVLCMTFAACNNDAIEVDPDPTPEDSLSNENAMYDMVFKTSVINNSPFCEINNENMDIISVVGYGKERGFVWNVDGMERSTCLIGGVNSIQDYWDNYGSRARYCQRLLFRNKDDHEVWDYWNSSYPAVYHEQYCRKFNWHTDIWQPAGNLKNAYYDLYNNNLKNVSFVAWATNSYIKTKADLVFPILIEGTFQSTSDHGQTTFLLSETTNSGVTGYLCEDFDFSQERYYKSEMLRDLVIAEASVPMIDFNEYRNGKPTPPIELKFSHPLARLEMKGVIEDDDALEVTVGYAAIGGLDMIGTYYPRWNNGNGRWETKRNYNGYYPWIEMKLNNSVHLTTTAKPLQEKGAEPWVFPQTIEKGWTNAAIGDGAGLMLGVWIKNKYDGSYIVGSEDGYGLVYMPLDPITLESENNYVFEVTFGCQYDVNGNPSGYHISYQPQIQPWNKTEKEVDMVKK